MQCFVAIINPVLV